MALRSCLSCIQLHPALKSVVFITNALDSQFVADKMEFCSILEVDSIHTICGQVLSTGAWSAERACAFRPAALVSARYRGIVKARDKRLTQTAEPQASSKDLTEFKQVISACEHVSAELARLNDATCTRLFAPIRCD